MDKLAKFIEPKNSRESAALRALDRAYQRGAHARLTNLRTAGDRATAVYASTSGAVYQVTVTRAWTACTCPAGQADRTCYHVAALADRVGMLDCLVYGFYSRGAIAAARVEVDRLARNPKSTADWFALQNARTRLASLTESRELVAA